ncbi:MAG: WYL domain-containing protein [Lachnospiraceae bacterium]|nr:WYL domain-containing protein [Lachnospiraceae bacterium]
MLSLKVTILCLYEILKQYSDENHILSVDEIRKKLKSVYGVEMERRAVYRNIDALREMNIEIEGYMDNRTGYYLVDRMFEPSDIRLLCDAVAASDVISDEMSKSIIEKLISTQSVYERSMLKRLVYVKDSNRSVNKNLFCNLDILNVAINQGIKVSLREVTKDYDMHDSVSSEAIVISPYATFWAEGEYYIIAVKEGGQELTHMKVGKLTDIKLLEQPVEMYFSGINPQEYAKRCIMNKGEHLIQYEIEITPGLWEDVVETFGESIVVKGYNETTIRLKINTIHSKIFGYVTGHLDQCYVTAPKEFREEIQKYVYEAYNRYW